MKTTAGFADFVPPVFVVEDSGGLPTTYGGSSMTTSNPAGFPATVSAPGVPAVVPPSLSDSDIATDISSRIGSRSNTGGAMGDPNFEQRLVNSLVYPRMPTELGSLGSPNAGLLGIRTPYIKFTYPSAKYPNHYNEHVGRPIETSAVLNSFHGYTVVSSIHLDNVSATLPEKNEIESLLKGGVIL